MQSSGFYYILFFIVIITSCNSGNDKASNTTESDNLILEVNASLPDAIKDIPIGIEVENSPDTIYAELNETNSKKYIWKHTTTIIALNSDLTIIEFGSYNFIDGKWKLGNYTNKPFTAEDFNTWYCRKKNGIITFDYCKDGKIQKDVEFIDPANYCIRKDSLVSRNGLWYYIGIDSIGNKYMGFDRYTTLDKLKN